MAVQTGAAASGGEGVLFFEKRRGKKGRLAANKLETGKNDPENGNSPGGANECSDPARGTSLRAQSRPCGQTLKGWWGRWVPRGTGNGWFVGGGTHFVSM